MHGIITDLRHGLRILSHAPGYSAAVIVVLAIGIALTTVAFAVVDGVLFKPLPFLRSHELYVVADATGAPAVIQAGHLDAWRQSIPAIRVAGIEFSAQSASASIEETFFDTTGERPWLGGFSPVDFLWQTEADRTGRRIVPVLLSHGRWLREFGGDAGVMGRTIIHREMLNDVSGERIVGVLPREFVFPLDTESGQPAALRPLTPELRESPSSRLYAIVRLPAPLTTAGVEAQLTSTAREVQRPVSPAGHRLPDRTPLDAIQLVRLDEHLARHERPAFALVTAGAGILLLLACVNVAGMVAARGVGQKRQIAIRRALGAGFWRLFSGALAETLHLSLAATVLALLVARPLLAWTLALLPDSITLLKPATLDVRVFTVAAVLAIATAVLTTLWPTRMAARMAIHATFTSLGVSATREVHRWMTTLIAAQVALAFLLLTAGSLTVTSLARTWWTEAGFDRSNLIFLEIAVNRASSRQETTEKLYAVSDLLRRADGVTAVAMSTYNPLFATRMNVWTSVLAQGAATVPDGVVSRQVSDNFFDVIGLRLVDGRWPASGEWRGQRAAIVSQTAARLLWPDEKAVGRALQLRDARNPETIPVIGVVADARFVALDEEPIGDIYLPDAISPGRYGLFYHVRTSGDADAVLPQVVAMFSGRDYRVARAVTHGEALFSAVKHRALPAWLFGSLGLGAIAIVGGGIAGVLAMSAAQRTREIGIRLALGATAGRVIRLLVREQLAAIALGLLAGLVGSLWIVRLIAAQLYGVTPYEPSIWTGVVLGIVTVALAATLLPSWRISRTDPAQALRAE